MRNCAFCYDKKGPLNAFVCHVCKEGFVCELCLNAWKKTGLFGNMCPTCRTPKTNKEWLKTFYSFADPLFFFIFVHLCIIIKMFPLGLLALEAIMLCLMYIVNRLSNIHIILAVSYVALLFYWPHFLFSVWNFCRQLGGEVWCFFFIEIVLMCCMMYCIYFQPPLVPLCHHLFWGIVYIYALFTIAFFCVKLALQLALHLHFLENWISLLVNLETFAMMRIASVVEVIGTYAVNSIPTYVQNFWGHMRD